MSSHPDGRPSLRLGPDEFRAACGRFATGVTVAAVMDAQGAPRGITVSSFTSVSLDPPLILIAIGHASSIIEEFRAAQGFSVNVLREEQRRLAEHFARKGESRFEGIDWVRGETGVPLIPDALAAIECARVERVTAGDHDIFIAQTACARVAEGRPLLYFSGAYRGLRL